jgi:hypothetical protein
MTRQTQLASLGWSQLFETQNGSGLLTAGHHVPTRRAVALFTGLFSVHIVLKGFRVRFVTSHAQRVIVHIFRIHDLRNWYL